MQNYRVPKEKASVLVEMPPHRPEYRFVFLAPIAHGHAGMETPSDIFNVPQAFIPLFREGGEVVLVRRRAIIWALVSNPRRAEWCYFEARAGVADAPIHIEFDTGAHLDGRIALAGPMGSRRVLDIINRQEGFLHVERNEELFLVNLERVNSITLVNQ
jgi:hypothetical protein